MESANGLSLSSGLLLVLASAFTGSLAAIMMKQIDNVRPLQFQAWVGAASVIPLIILTLAFETDQYSLALAAGWPFVSAVLFSALIVSMLAHTIYYGLIRIYPANLIAPLIVLSPLLTVILGILITRDAFDLRMGLGTAIALAGVVIITIRPNLMTSLFGKLGTLRRKP